jgi:hypothetical protein
MSELPRAAPGKAPGWADLVEELDRWGKAGRVATLWWRDDDAVTTSAKLDQLMGIAENVPVAIAVIPAAAEPGLAGWLARSARRITAPIFVLQHGWQHANHSAGGRKSEFPAERACEDVLSDLSTGRARLSALFGVDALPILVPPWNRFDDSFLPLLDRCGLSAISRIGSRRAARPAVGLTEVNVHVDLVAWAGDRAFIGEGAALGGLIGHLRARRLAEASADEPTGILTHHLVQDEAADAFLSRLIATTHAHSAARWLEAIEVFAPAMRVPA